MGSGAGERQEEGQGQGRGRRRSRAEKGHRRWVGAGAASRGGSAGEGGRSGSRRATQGSDIHRRSPAPASHHTRFPQPTLQPHTTIPKPHQGIVVAGYRVSRRHGAVQADTVPAGRAVRRDAPRIRLEVALGVLGSDAALDGEAAGRRSRVACGGWGGRVGWGGVEVRRRSRAAAVQFRRAAAVSAGASRAACARLTRWGAAPRPGRPGPAPPGSRLLQS